MIPNRLYLNVNVLRFFILALFSLTANSAEVTAAVAANFSLPMKDIIVAFERQSNHTVSLSYGSSGKLYAQILHGAPFDVFLSADQDKPAALARSGLGIANSRFTYTQGTLTLMATTASKNGPRTRLTNGEFNKLAIANPRLAPYGAAARDALQALGLWESITPKLVIGKSVGQVYQFVTTGTAELAFIATAQVQNRQDTNLYWQVPTELYTPIYQDALLLRKGENNPAAIELLEFLQSEPALSIMRHYGYQLSGQQ